MSRGDYQPIPLIFIILAAIIIVLLVSPAWADSGHGHNHDAGDVVVGSSDSSHVFGFGGNDVDIAQCYRSYSVIIWQDSKPNYFCIADALDAKGLHKAAAITRCSVKSFSKLFDDCVMINTMRPALAVVMEEPEDDDEDDHRETEQAHEEDLGELKSRMDKLESDRKAATRRAAQQQEKDQQAAQKVIDVYQEKINE